MKRREFILGLGAIAAGSSRAAEREEILPHQKGTAGGSCPLQPTEDEALDIRFVGTGSAGWQRGSRSAKIFRRYSSVLVDRLFLIDYTWMGADMIPEGVHPKTIVYTHSHPDHYDPKAALQLGITDVYLSRTWAQDAEKEFAAAAEKLALPSPEIHPVDLQRPFMIGKCHEILPLPANHWTGRPHEQAQIYVIRKICRGGSVRLLYATDTSGIPSGAYFGAVRRGKYFPDSPSEPITGAIMEASGRPGRPFDGLMISHSSADSVNQIFTTFLRPKKPGEKNASYTPPEGQPVYLTHIGYRDWGQNTYDDILPKGLKVPSDGLEVAFRPPA